MSLTGVEPLARVRRFIAGVSELEDARIERLIGDASNRAYFRLVLSADDTRILALLPESFDRDSLPFLNVASLLAEIPIRIPRVIDVAGEQGVLVLEDLGDNLLQDAVDGAGIESRTKYYHEAVDILGTLQRRGDELRNDRFLPYRTAFDREKFMWELEFFRKHFLEGFRACTLDASERDELAEAFDALSAELCTHTFVLCHRDYHSRNLMVAPGAVGNGVGDLVVIDFQDARQGPRAYDLASLLNDSYVVHTPDFVAAMTDRFERALDVDLSEDYDVVALQRNLKALGTFGYQIGHRDNAVYERYVEGTLAMVRANLERNPRWDSLRRILARHCEEIG